MKTKVVAAFKYIKTKFESYSMGHPKVAYFGLGFIIGFLFKLIF